VQRLVEEVAAVEVQHVEEERAEQHPLVCHLPTHPTAEAAHRVLERPRPAVVVQGEGLAVEDGGLTGQRPHLRHELGNAVGDLAQRAGPHPDDVAVAVHLDAGSVELELHGDVGAQVGERGVEGGPGAGEHRPHRPADLQALRVEGVDPAGHRGGCRLWQPTGEHERAADVGGGDVGGGRDGVQHHALQSALAQFPGEQPDEELLLVGGGGRQQRGEGRVAAGGGPRTGRGGELGEGPVDRVDGQRRRGGGCAGHPRQRAPADAEPALSRLAGQPGGDRLDLVGARPAQQVRDGGGLGRPGSGRGDRGGGGEDVGEQHRAMVPADRPALSRRRGGEP
jgi:hypothetical protein